VRFFLEQCLCSVQKALEKTEGEILVIDNLSGDGSLRYLQPLFPEVVFIPNSKNEGFAKANNKALQKANGETILFLNPDTLIAENSLLDCIQFLASNSNAGAIGVQMIDGSGRFLPESKRAFPTLYASFFKMSGLSFLFSRSALFNQYALGNLDTNSLHPVDVVAGAFMMVRRELLISLGGFDEHFFMYGEDIDLSYRILQSGYQNYYLGNYRMIHFKGESSRKQSIPYIQSFYGAMVVFVQKHYSNNKAALFSLFIHIAIILRIALHYVYRFFLAISNFLPVPGLNKQPQKIMVLGGVNELEAGMHLLQQENSEDWRCFTLKTAENFTDITDLCEQIIELAEQEEITALLFCQGELCYDQIMELMVLLPHHFMYYFFSANSHSIVSSHSKINSGQTIPKKSSNLI
jgi:GT2 family glycosyltransferase